MAKQHSIPYIMTPGRIPALFQRISEAATPPRFSQDFLETKLALKGGSATPLIPLLKKLGFLSEDGTPTELYKKFRNPDTSKQALATGMRRAYEDLFSSNEYAHELTKDKLQNLMMEITGLAKDTSTLISMVSTFWTLKEFADFDQSVSSGNNIEEPTPSFIGRELIPAPIRPSADAQVGLNLSYTINLNLPNTTDVEVFNAIFRSLRENLLKE